MSEPRWVTKAALVLLHAEALAEHGGPEGIRDEAALESALARPLNLFAYGGTADISALAAAYAAGVNQNHPFVDGNKRAAFIAMGLFLALNGLRLIADQVEATRVVLAFAAGEIGEQNLADWIRQRVQPR
jgi:death on curing protein